MTDSMPGHLREDARLRVEHLVQTFPVRGGVVQAVSDVSFDIRAGETLGLVGESGSGKSTTGRAVLQLPAPTSGSVRFDGEELTGLSVRRMRPYRRHLQMVFQDPVSALNPRRRVRDIIAEGLNIAGVPAAQVRDRVDEALRAVGLDPALVGDRRPHQFSGGQCQRIAIARAMVLRPQVLVCDEPVASLDVSIQAQVLNLLEEMRRSAEGSLAMLFISHDLAVVRTISDRIAVMYLGKIVEIGDADEVYAAPAHPYTQALLAALPVPDPDARPERAVTARGEIPSPLNPPSGCRFRTRCPIAEPICAEVEPLLNPQRPDHHVACHFPLAAPLEERREAGQPTGR